MKGVDPALPERLLWGHAGELTPFAVDVETFAGGVCFEDTDGCIVRQSREIALGVVESFLKLLSFEAPNPFGLPFDLSRSGEKVDEAGDLRTDDRRHERLHEIIHSTQRVGPFHRELFAVKGGQKDDRNIAVPFILPNAFCGLETIEPGHLDIEEHDRKSVSAQLFNGLFAGGRLDERMTEVLEHGSQCEAIFAAVID